MSASNGTNGTDGEWEEIMKEDSVKDVVMNSNSPLSVAKQDDRGSSPAEAPKAPGALKAIKRTRDDPTDESVDVSDKEFHKHKGEAFCTRLGATLKAELQYSEMPTSTGTYCPSLVPVKLVVQVNATAIPDSVALVLCLDVSCSMGCRSEPHSGVSLMVQTLERFIKHGLPGRRVFLRLVTFGVYSKILGEPDPTGLVELTDESRPAFLEAVASLDGDEGGTNISAAVDSALSLINKFQGSVEVPSKPLVSHVVILTDGAANRGHTSPDAFKRHVDSAVGDKPIFTHFLGLGGAVRSDFMKVATDNGNQGLFKLAPEPSQILMAYEEIFGMALDATAALDIFINDAHGWTKKRYGMLTVERKIFTEVQIKPPNFEGEVPVVTVSLGSGGIMVDDPISLQIKFSKGGQFKGGSKAIEEAAQLAQVEKDRLQIMAIPFITAGEAARLVRTKIDSYVDQGYSGNAILRSRQVSEKLYEADTAPQYRSLGVAAVGLLDAEMSSQQATF